MPQTVLGELILKITGNNAQFDDSIDNSQKKMTAMESKFAKLDASLKKFGQNATKFVTLPILAIGVAMVKTAIDAEETGSKFRTVFKDVAKEADKVAKTLSKDFGLSGTAAQKLLGDTGDLLSGFGFTGKAALDMSKEVNELAVDLASFTNFSGGAAGASAALTKALLGERESVKSLGIAILEEDVKKKVLELTNKGLTFETERQAKAYATLAIAQEQSKNAIGDFARTQDSAANQIRQLGADLQDLAVEFGTELIPFVKDMIKNIRGLVGAFSEMSDATKSLVLNLAGIAALVGPLTTIFGPLGLLIAGVGALAALNKASFESSKQYKIMKEAVDENAKARRIHQIAIKGSIEGIAELDRVSGVAARNIIERLIEETQLKIKLLEIDTETTTHQGRQAANKDRIIKLDKKIAELREQELKINNQIIIANTKFFDSTIEGEKRRKTVITETIDTIVDGAEKETASIDDVISKVKEKTDIIIEENEKIIVNNEAYTDKLEELNNRRLKAEAAYQAKILETEQLIKQVTDLSIGSFTDIVSATISAGIAGEDAWEAFADAAKNAIAVVVDALAQEFAIRSVAAFVTGNIPAGVGWAGAAVAAGIAANVIRSLADGGLVMPTAGGTIVRMAEAGVPEFAVPERSDVMNRLADRISANMDRPNVSNVSNVSNRGGDTLNIDGREFKVWMQDEMKKGNIIIPKKAVR